MALTDGAAAKVNWSAGEVAEVPPGVVRVISTVPAGSAGEVAVQAVVELHETPAAVAPKLAVVLPTTKPVPVTSTVVAPATGPTMG